MKIDYRCKKVFLSLRVTGSEKGSRAAGNQLLLDCRVESEEVSTQRRACARL